MRVIPGPDETYLLNQAGDIVNPATEDGNLASISSSLNVDLSTLATESTASAIKEKTNNLTYDADNRLRVNADTRPDKEVSGNISAADNLVVISSEGYASVSVKITGAWVGTLIAEVSVDGGVSWFPAPLIAPPPDYAVSFGMPVTVNMITANGTYQVAYSGAISHYRIRGVSWTSGTASVYLRASVTRGIYQFTNSAIKQQIYASTANRSATNLNVGETFTGSPEGTLGSAYIQWRLSADQTCEVDVQQSVDGINWDHHHKHIVPAGHSHSDSVLSVGEYYRISVKNLGPSATTYFRLSSYLCPMASETRPIAGVGQMSGWFGEPDITDTHQVSHLRVDRQGSLMTRGPVLSDAGSFEDRFYGTSLDTNIPSTTYFTSGSEYVSNTGVDLHDYVRRGQYVRLSSHPVSAFTQVEVVGETTLTLEDGYLGSSGSGTAVVSNWRRDVSLSGSISVSSNRCNIASGATTGSSPYIFREIDYLPLHFTSYASVSARRANQAVTIGLVDKETSPTIQAVFEFTGTESRYVTCKIVTSTGESEVSTVLIPGGKTSADYNFYEIRVTPRGVAFFINRVQKYVSLNVPVDSYLPLGIYFGVSNTGVTSSTTLTIENVTCSNIEDIQVASFQLDPSNLQVTPNGVYNEIPPVLVDGMSLPQQLTSIGDTKTSNLPRQATDALDGKLFYFDYLYSLATSGTEYNIILIRVPPAPATLKMLIDSLSLNVFTANADVTYRIYIAPTYTVTGTAIPIFNCNYGHSNAPTVLLTSLPTVTNRGTLLRTISAGRNQNELTIQFNYARIFGPGSVLLISATANANNTSQSVSMVWGER